MTGSSDPVDDSLAYPLGLDPETGDFNEVAYAVDEDGRDHDEHDEDPSRAAVGRGRGPGAGVGEGHRVLHEDR